MKCTFTPTALASRLGAALAALALQGALLLDGPPMARAAEADRTAPAARAAEESLQEIVVTGLRANLEKSLEIKRNSPVVLDSIDSTELGRFPDADVADSLAHLPGITLQRTTGGEGAKVRIRGLDTQYNITTFNGRIIANDDDGRDLAFDVLPAEVISGADVLKSAESSAVEGSIGGTVNLRTASAFSRRGLHAGVHAEGDWNEMSRLHGSKFSAFVTDTLADDTLGFVLGGVHSDAHVRTDSLNAYSQNFYGPNTYHPGPNPFDGAPGSVPLTATPCCITFGSIFDTKKLDALSGRLEWRPSEALALAADALYTHLNDPQIGYNQSYYFATNGPGDPLNPPGSSPPWSNPTVVGNTVTGVTVGQFQPEMVNNTMSRKVDTWMYGLNAHWQLDERLSLTGDIYRSKASRPEGGKDTFVTAGLVSPTPSAQDILILQDLPHSLPSINVLVPFAQFPGLTACPAGTASAGNAGYCSYSALLSSGFLNDNKYWSTHYDGLNGFSVEDRVNGFTLDGAFKEDIGVFERLLFGIGYTDRAKSRTDISNDWNGGSGQYGNLYNTYPDVQPAPYSFAPFNVVSITTVPHFMQGAGGVFPPVLTQLNVGQLFAFLKSLDGKPSTSACVTAQGCTSFFDFAHTLPQPNPYNSYRVTEKTLSFYVEQTLSASRWSGNFGVRVVHTRTSAATATSVPTALWILNDQTSTPSYQVIYGTSQPIGANGTYTIALPSLNIAFWAIPDRLQTRLALAETLSRPNLNQLAPTSYNNGINGTPELYYTGTAGLKPVRARQIDLSAEWYYRPHAAFTAALFGKKLRDDIYTGSTQNVDLGTIRYVGGPPGVGTPHPFPWTVYAPANGSSSRLYGFELTWQHFLENGLGARLQYTHTYIVSYDQKGAHVYGGINAPPGTLSAGLIYDKGPLSAAINFDHQQVYTASCATCTEIPGWPAVAESFDWMTATVRYKFWRGLEISAEGRNLTNSISRTYLNDNPLLPWANGQNVGGSVSGVGNGYTAYGRTYILGLSWSM